MMWKLDAHKGGKALGKSYCWVSLAAERSLDEARSLLGRWSDLGHDLPLMVSGKEANCRSNVSDQRTV